MIAVWLATLIPLLASTAGAPAGAASDAVTTAAVPTGAEAEALLAYPTGSLSLGGTSSGSLREPVRVPQPFRVPQPSLARLPPGRVKLTSSPRPPSLPRPPR